MTSHQGNTSALSLEGLCKTYRTLRGPIEALHDLTFQVRRGEIVGYIGVNGAGKSTSIKILLGLVRATRGTGTIFGYPAGSLEARRRVGYLPEVANYHEFMTSQELLRVHAGLAGVHPDDVERRCDHCLGLVGLGARRNSRISEFSKGMKQRFGIAQALIGDPPLLILDELTSGLDPFAQRELRDIMLELRSRDITIFFSSHHMTEIEALCDRVVIIHRGRLCAQGTVAELTESPQWVRVLLQAPDGPLPALPGLQPVPQEPTLLSAVVAREASREWIRQAVEAGCDLRELAPVRVQMEEVFRQATLAVPA